MLTDMRLSQNLSAHLWVMLTHTNVIKSQYPPAGHADRYMPVIQSSLHTPYVQKSICHSGL